MKTKIEEFFQCSAVGTNFKTEILAGLTTFMTMSYIIFVNPQILSAAGMDYDAAFVATCLTAAIGTILLGFYANYPIAMAPGMGMNAYFTYGVVIGMGYTWQVGLGIVFISGIIFLLICIFPIRRWIIDAIPLTLKKSIVAAIGLFLGTIGLQNAGLIIDHPQTLVTVGSLTSPTVLLALLGFFLIVFFEARSVLGGILLSILLVAIAGYLLGLSHLDGVLSMPPSLAPTFLQLDILGVFEAGFLAIIFAFLFVDFFDSVGSLMGVTQNTNLVDKDHRLPRMKQSLIADSVATIAGGVLGTSPTTAFIESASGIKAGGRTGLTAIVVGVLFILALFFSPLAKAIPSFATAPALIYVAFCMVRGMKDIPWDDMSDYLPAIIVLITMPLTYSIAHGIAFGFISFVVIKLLYGRYNEVSPLMFVLTSLFVLKFALL